MLCRCTCLLLALCATSCREQRQPEPSPIFSKESAPDDTVQHYDLPDIQEATLLIGGTLSGPDTYYEYRGQGMGRQFRLAEEFARSIGVRLQMDIAPDTATLRQRLASGDIDFIALDMPKWSTRRDAPELASAISEWWTGGARDAVLRSLQSTPRVTRRHMRPVMKDRARGIISPYDDLLMRHSRQIRWDWRLLAALCYQESGFDPQAVSWALTAKHGGNPQVWEHVAPYVLRLSDPRFYRDPVVRYGYMRGSETSEYVRLIMERWTGYRQAARPSAGGSLPAPAKKDSRYNPHRTQVKSPEEWVPEDTLWQKGTPKKEEASPTSSN